MTTLFDEDSKPCIFTGSINKWGVSTWTPEKLAEILHDVQIRFRIGRKDNTEVQFETGCNYEDASVQDFCEWLQFGSSPEKNRGTRHHFKNPLLKYNRDEYFCYADYKYMKDVFANDHNVLKQVDWRVFGLPEQKCEDSTLWLGCEGAYTVCHYDTYGWNLVAQIYGRKRWVLFPPTDSENLYPTRLPYEESSVFSRVNIARPNLLKDPKFKKTSVYSVILEPGDVLYVPRHWWHYVECLEPALSINTWVDLEADRQERMKEAVTRTLMHSLLSDQDLTWINPTEEESTMETNLSLLKYSLNEQFSQNQLKFRTEFPQDESLERKKTVCSYANSRSINEDQAANADSKTALKDCDVNLSEGYTHKESICDDDRSAQKRPHKPEEDHSYNTEESIPRKKTKTGSELLTDLFNKTSGKPVKKLTFTEYLQTVNTSNVTGGFDVENDEMVTHNESSGDPKSEHKTCKHDIFTVADFAECVVDLDVINLICEKIKAKYVDKSSIYSNDSLIKS